MCIWASLVIQSEKAMAPHSSTLAWKIPWTEEAGRLQSMGSLKVAHNWVTSLSLFTFMHWRRKWQSTPVFLPGESQGQGSLVGCRLWGCTESDTTEATQQQQQQWFSGKESTCQWRKPGFDLWVGKILWKRQWLPTLVFLPGKSHGQRSLMDYSPCGWKSRTWLSDWTHTMLLRHLHPVFHV